MLDIIDLEEHWLQLSEADIDLWQYRITPNVYALQLMMPRNDSNQDWVQ